jgi:hypothetical protein
VYLTQPGHPNPYQAQVRRGGNQVTLGRFATSRISLCPTWPALEEERQRLLVFFKHVV